jgi:hypothetical protein
MNCGQWEERVALYAGGDLASEDARAVESHLAECAGCQILLSGLPESLGLLREAHAEPVDAAHLAAVRARVLAELERGRNRWWRLAWVGAAAVLAVLLFWAVRPAAPPVSRIAKLPPAPSPVIATAPRPREARSRQLAKPRERKLPPPETVLVKLESNDPDVVIYWITETKGEPK